jgi:hypothetical protein
MNISQLEHGENGESEGVVNQSLLLRPIASVSRGLGLNGVQEALPFILHCFRTNKGVWPIPLRARLRHTRRETSPITQRWRSRHRLLVHRLKRMVRNRRQRYFTQVECEALALTPSSRIVYRESFKRDRFSYLRWGRCQPVFGRHAGCMGPILGPVAAPFLIFLPLSD